jgi:tRNA U34 2-thiouridine synthase MnmA/TrmU
LNKKALVLLSGGLDSTLVIEIMRQQKIEIEAVNFFTPFCTCTRTKGCGYEAKRVADKFGLPLKVFNVSKEYIEIIKAPKYGYGKGLNPCIDCRIFMFKKAKEYMQEVKADFIVTGEVLGQRPMSQHRQAMKIIERDSGLTGLVLRPLSAKLLEPTLPEEKSWVDREKLLDISGRSRKPQIALAKKLSIKEYPCSAGGCLLTDPVFARKMKDLLKFTNKPTLNDIQLLKIGRHFRLSQNIKIIVGRNEKENKKLIMLAKEKDITLGGGNFKGPVVLIKGKPDNEAIFKAAAICARYSDDKGKSGIKVNENLGKEKVLNVSPIDDVVLEKLRI